MKGAKAGRVKVEVCCADIESVARAVECGADRIELCTALTVGGVTPSPSLIEEALEIAGRAQVPVNVLVRPREGNFAYDGREHRLVMADLEWLASRGAFGAVVGALLPDGRLDMEKCLEMRKEFPQLRLTFSRAIDVCQDIHLALGQLIDLGYDRVLTSGGAPTAMQGAQAIRQMVEQSAGRIAIMAGSGVNASNWKQLVELTGVREIHGSFSSISQPVANCRQLPGLDATVRLTDPETLKSILKETKNEKI